MLRLFKVLIGASVLALVGVVPATAADKIGQIKVSSGEVFVIRAGDEIAAAPGVEVFESDQIRTGENSAVGMTFSDNSRISLGPNSTLDLESYAFNKAGKQNGFDARLKRGSLTAASGQIAKTRPLAMRVLMPTTVLGVKGTEFAVRVSDPDAKKGGDEG
jgi:hypothetical protein